MYEWIDGWMNVDDVYIYIIYIIPHLHTRTSSYVRSNNDRFKVTKEGKTTTWSLLLIIDQGQGESPNEGGLPCH